MDLKLSRFALGRALAFGLNTFVGCGDNSSTKAGNAEKIQNKSIAGVSQKGPFVTGSVVRLYELDAFSFMMMDLDEMEKKIHSAPNDKKGKAGEPTITAGMIQSALHAEKEREEAERKAWFVENFDSLTLLDIYASEWIGEIRRNVIRDLLQAETPEEVIKSIIRPEIEEGQVLQKKAMWMEMRGKVECRK